MALYEQTQQTQATLQVYSHLLKMVRDGFDFFARIPEPGRGLEQIALRLIQEEDIPIVRLYVDDEKNMEMMQKTFIQAVGIIYKLREIEHKHILAVKIHTDTPTLRPIEVWEIRKPKRNCSYTIAQLLSLQH